MLSYRLLSMVVLAITLFWQRKGKNFNNDNECSIRYVKLYKEAIINYWLKHNWSLQYAYTVEKFLYIMSRTQIFKCKTWNVCYPHMIIPVGVS